MVVRIFPLLFSLFLDLIPLNFLDRWSETVKQANDQGIGFDLDQTKGFYEQVSIYVFDELRVGYSLSFSFFYIGALYVIGMARMDSQQYYLAISTTSLLFFGLSALSFFGVQAWYSPDIRSPGRYHQYYVRGSGADQVKIRDRFMRFSNPRIDRLFSPRKFGILSQISLISVVVAIELLTPGESAYWGLLIGVILVFVGCLVFPSKNQS